MKMSRFLAFLTLMLIGYAFSLPSYAMFGKGKWMNVYNGHSTPQYKECVSAIASKCVVGDSRGVAQL